MPCQMSFPSAYSPHIIGSVQPSWLPPVVFSLHPSIYVVTAHLLHKPKKTDLRPLSPSRSNDSFCYPSHSYRKSSPLHLSLHCAVPNKPDFYAQTPHRTAGDESLGHRPSPNRHGEKSYRSQTVSHHRSPHPDS